MAKRKKQYLWLPYAGSIEAGRKQVNISYKGGCLKTAWKDIHSIMFYGNSTDFPQDFLEKCAFYKIPVVVHRRNMPRAVVISPTLPPDQENLLTKQIIFRENEKKRAHIGKRLLQAKFKSMGWLKPANKGLLYRLTNLDKMLSIEAWHAKGYWREYYRRLNIESRRRDKDGDIAEKCLDAVSKFVSGVVLRWVLYHSLSPYHGFLHKPTNYPSLVYDLIEPYRGYFDKVVFNSISQAQKESLEEESKIIALTIESVKHFLDSQVYVGATRQLVTFQELLHGVVLALRIYLLGETKRFIIPLPSRPNGGRPIKAGYSLYGHTAGKTDFWERARKAAQETSALTDT